MDKKESSADDMDLKPLVTLFSDLLAFKPYFSVIPGLIFLRVGAGV